jgi:hypothetical protein
VIDTRITAEKRPRRLEPGDDRGQVLAEGQPHIAMPAVDRGEHQGVHHTAAPGAGIMQQAHLPEAGLAFGARLAVGHPHCRLPAAAVAKDLQRVAVQRPLRHDHALPGQQLPGLNHCQARTEQLLQPFVTRRQQRPALTVPGGPVRADGLGHPAEQLVPELPLTPGPVQAAGPSYGPPAPAGLWSETPHPAPTAAALP